MLATLQDAFDALDEIVGKRSSEDVLRANLRQVLYRKMTADVIVIGAGHAGCEAAHAAVRLGCRVALCTLSPDTVGHMPCNPAIGGTAKGHLVREIDALGGLMGEAIDATGIQFKLLNRSRGPAVWSPRAQADKRVYSRWMRARLEARAAHRLDLRAGHAPGRRRRPRRRRDVSRTGGGSGHRAVVVTTGTFLNGLVHIGREQRPAGRAGEPPSHRARRIGARRSGFAGAG